MQDENNRELLRDFINRSQPFGPADSGYILDREVMRELFDFDNDIYRSLANRPSIVIGRRGSGKTALLHSTAANEKYQVKAEIAAAGAFTMVVRSIQQIADAAGVNFVEAFAEIWDLLFQVTVMQRLLLAPPPRADAQKLACVRNFLGQVGVAGPMNCDDTLMTATQVVRDEVAGGTVFEAMRRLKGGEVRFEDACRAVESVLSEAKTRAIVVMDSLEGYELDQQAVQHAMSGLLKALGNYPRPGSRLDVRVCLPSELYHALVELSTNPIKDFSHRLTLHWTASELIQIAARRAAVFLELYEPEFHEAQGIGRMDVDSRGDAARLLGLLLPEKIRNRVGVVEQPLAYILRHTQLLPRHLVIYLNEIWTRNLRNRGSPTRVSEDAVRDGLFEVERTICHEIFSAFRHAYPHAREACAKCIPDLPLQFPAGELHKVFNRLGKRAMEGGDYDDFRRMLIEIGAVGRVVEETRKYVVGEFEYTVPSRQMTGTEDRLCLHPVFSQCYSARMPRPGANAKVIYPKGSGIDSDFG